MLLLLLLHGWLDGELRGTVRLGIGEAVHDRGGDGWGLLILLEIALWLALSLWLEVVGRIVEGCTLTVPAVVGISLRPMGVKVHAYVLISWQSTWQAVVTV